MSHHNSYNAVINNQAGSSRPYIAVPLADFRADELEKSFRGFLAGAMSANQRAKLAVDQLAPYGSAPQLASNSHVVSVACTRWYGLLTRALFAESHSGRTATFDDSRKLFRGTGIPQSVGDIENAKNEQTVKLAWDEAEQRGDIPAQIKLLETVVNRGDFNQLEANTQTMKAQLSSQPIDLDDATAMSPR